MAGRSGLAAAAPSRGLLREALAAWSPAKRPSGAAARPAAARVPAEDARPGRPGKDRSRRRAAAGGPAVQGRPAAHRGGAEISRRGRRRDGEGMRWGRNEMDSLIDITDVSKVFAGGARTVALDGVTLHIAAGEFTAVMGASGSGKS